MPTNLAPAVLDPDPPEENQDVETGTVMPLQALGDGLGRPAGDIESG